MPRTKRDPWPRNVRSFLAFRLLFNARFYYPVLAIFFVDLGLTLDQYALLNVAWAVSIVLFELPLGAVSDRIGRRPLIVLAAALMIVEMSVLGFAPTGNPTLLFVLFLVNRVLSGLAEAAASGADEALAYDTLLEVGREKEWPDVLARLQRIMAVGFLLATLIGAAVYDSSFLNSVLGFFGIDATLAPETTVRFPVYCTLVLAIGAFFAALGMTEPDTGVPKGKVSLAGSIEQIRAAGRFVLRTKFVLATILFFLVLDSVVRLFLTLTSSYYRMIGIPSALFGVLGAVFAILGFVSPTIAKAMLKRLAPKDIFAVISVLMLTALTGFALLRNWTGALFTVPLGIGFSLLGFFCSQFLNEATDSSKRATVLSVKSLAGNLAYGAAGILYAVAYKAAGAAGEAVQPEGGSSGEDELLRTTLLFLPIVLVVVNVPLFFWGRKIPRMRQKPSGTPPEA